MFAAYKAWMEKYAEQIVDPGDRLLPGGKILTPTGVVDGPFVEAKEIVAGYMILSTESYEQAVEIMKAGPGAHVQTGSFEIRELSGAEM